MKDCRVFFAATAVLGLLPVAACAAPAARVAEGPLAEAVRKGIGSGRGAFDHGAWDTLIRRLVDGEGRVDYAGFHRDRRALDAYLAAVAKADVASLSAPEVEALLINAYNACTVRLILDGTKDGRLPASIRDLSDPWVRKVCAVGGETVSLDTIEHGLLRPLFRDTRIHAAVNCGSKGCPVLVPWAYRGERIEAQLQERMTAMASSEIHVRVEDRRLRVSSIFDWYKDDFVGGGSKNGAPTIAAYLLRYASPELQRRIEATGPAPKVDFLDYDWSLNGR